MDIDPIELVDSTKESTSPKHRWLNPAVAVTVALLATFVGNCKVKDDPSDLSDAAIAIAIAMLAVTSVTELPWLFFLVLLASG